MEDKKFLTLFLDKLQKLYDFFLKNPSKLIDSTMISEYTKDMSEEEREVIEDACDYIDIYYQKRKELDESGKEPEKWLEDDIEATARELEPDASAEDITKLKEAAVASIMERIDTLTDILDAEMAPVSEVLNKKGGEA